ncbi:chemotaxis protein CheW [Isoalcanivorax beigongshangi]|uniref:Chemotaxis protein CheW n=1 Tax=Isoalcanivorax beigongshangi TaxID=3238810 RepID=A0ABV4ADL1_9GAMM
MNAASAAYATLADFHARSRHLAVQLPIEQQRTEQWSGIGVVLGGVRLVAPLDQVAEILNQPPYTRVPGVLNWLKGVANVRGRLMTVMDLPGFLDLPSTVPERRRRLLVVDEGDLYTGMAVDEVLGMQHFPPSAWRDTPPPVSGPLAPYIDGAYERDGQWWPVLSLHRLVDDPRFLDVARSH